MKNILKTTAEALLLIFLLPQIFILLYFFWGTIRIGMNGLSLMKDLALLGFSVSQLSSPFLYLLYWLIRHINRKEAHCLATFLICFVAGYAGVVAWNLVVFPNFSYGWAILPVLICSGGTSAYMAIRDKERQLPDYGGELFLAKD
jgi:hypothetical protein